MPINKVGKTGYNQWLEGDLLNPYHQDLCFAHKASLFCNTQNSNASY